MTSCIFGQQVQACRQKEKLGLFRDEFEVPLTKVWTALRGIDCDLAELAANVFEQVLSLEDCMGTAVMSIIGGGILWNSTPRSFFQMNPPNGWKADAKHRLTPNLEERFDMFRGHVLYLLDCTEVVHDYHVMLYAGKQEKVGVQASFSALHYLHQVQAALVKWESWVHEAT